MNRLSILAWPILVLTLNFSCTEKKPSLKKSDSSEFVNYSKKDGLKFTSGIRAVFQDRRGNYWFGSHQEGLCLFDGESYQYFTTHEGLPDNQVRSIQEDLNGNIWFGTANGIGSYDGEKITNRSQELNGDSQSEWTKTGHDLWFNAGNNPGVYRYDGQRLNYLAFPSPKIINPNNVYFTTGIAEGENDMLWIGTYAGVFGYNGKQFTVINDETLRLQKETGELHVRSIFEDSKGRLWIGNNGIGVLMLDGDSTVNFSEKNDLIHPTSSRRGDQSPAGTLEHVFAISEDSKGNIWFGDRDTGAWKYDGKSLTNYTIDDKLNSQMIWHIFEDRNNNLLFAMADGGVYQFDGHSFEKRF